MEKTATFTKTVGRSRTAFVIWIPKDVALLLTLKRKDILEVRIRKLRGGEAS